MMHGTTNIKFCSLKYPACKARALCYIVISGLSVCTIFFPHYLKNGTVRKEKLLDLKCVLWFCLPIYSNIYPTRCNVTQFICIWKLLYMFRVVSPPIIRSTHKCIYSIWNFSNRNCYRGKVGTGFTLWPWNLTFK